MNRNKEMYVEISTFPVLFSFSLLKRGILLDMTKKYDEISMSSILLRFSSMGRNDQKSAMFLSQKITADIVWAKFRNAPSAPPWDWINGLGDLRRRFDEICWQMERNLIWAPPWLFVLTLILLGYLARYWAVALNERGNLWKLGGMHYISQFQNPPDGDTAEHGPPTMHRSVLGYDQSGHIPNVAHAGPEVSLWTRQHDANIKCKGTLEFVPGF